MIQELYGYPDSCKGNETAESMEFFSYPYDIYT